jgi:hypothetical protein
MAMVGVRRADFLMTLAYATDLATGHSRDFALRSCVLSMRLADVAQLSESMRRNVYHQALLRYIGCTGFKNFVADPELPAILKEAGHVGKPQPAILGGKFGA